jgi:capsule biosynthesis phosphatase
MERQEIAWSNTIVVDVDDTISTHINRDYENAVPHEDMITKLNKMYDMNYRIVYFTARGQISCKGDIDLINETKRPVLERWLEKHSVKYDELQFGKPLGLWYVDDKALRPDEFLELEIEELHGGSGAVIRREGNAVIKECSNAFTQAQWYRNVNGYVNAPSLHSIIENTLKIDYIDGTPGFCIDSVWQLKKVIEEVHKIGFIDVNCEANFDTYIARVKSHLETPESEELSKTEKEYILTLLEHNSAIFDSQKSFCHGDLTLGNVIIKGKLERTADAFIFDPNVPDNVWTSHLLDLAKINQSLRFNYEYEFMDAKTKYPQEVVDYFQNEVLNTMDLKLSVIILELTHWVRMIKYKEPIERKMVIRNIRILLEKIKENDL